MATATKPARSRKSGEVLVEGLYVQSIDLNRVVRVRFEDREDKLKFAIEFAHINRNDSGVLLGLDEYTPSYILRSDGGRNASIVLGRQREDGTINLRSDWSITKNGQSIFILKDVTHSCRFSRIHYSKEAPLVKMRKLASELARIYINKTAGSTIGESYQLIEALVLIKQIELIADMAIEKINEEGAKDPSGLARR